HRRAYPPANPPLSPRRQVLSDPTARAGVAATLKLPHYRRLLIRLSLSALPGSGRAHGWLRVFDFYEFLCGEALLLESSFGFESFDFAFEFSGSRGEFDFARYRPDREAVVEDQWREFSKRVRFECAFAVVEDFYASFSTFFAFCSHFVPEGSRRRF